MQNTLSSKCDFPQTNLWHQDFQYLNRLNLHLLPHTLHIPHHAMKYSKSMHFGPKATALAFFFLLIFSSLSAVNFNVNTTADTPDASPGNGVCSDPGGNCSLRAAIMEANALAGTDSIILPNGTYLLTRAGTGENACNLGDLDITSNVIIRGTTARLTIIDADSIDRVFHVLSGATLTLLRLEVHRGFIVGDHGGGIFNLGTVNATDVSLYYNGTRGAVGGTVTAGGWGGGIYTTGNLNFTRVTLGYNTAIGSRGENGVLGGGGGGGGAGMGGAIYQASPANSLFLNCTFSGNEAIGGEGGGGSRWSGSTYTGNGGAGGGLGGAGGVGSGAMGTVGGFGGGGGGASGSPTSGGAGSPGAAGGFGGGGGAGSGNAFGSGAAAPGAGGQFGGAGQVHCCDASGGGGGGGGLGGAIFNNGGTIGLGHCTVAYNDATGGLGGQGNYGGRGVSGSGVGGGVFNNSGTFNLNITLLGENTASTSNLDLYGTFSSFYGRNLVQNPGAVVVPGAGNVLNQNPRLGPLANNGGKTNTHRLLPCNPPSPAINAGATGFGLPALDQRDSARVGLPDIGAFENRHSFAYTNPLTNQTFCQNQTVSLDAGPGFAHYVWSNGDTTQIAVFNTGGSISVTVSDTFGCTGTGTATLTMNPAPTPNLGPDSAHCGSISQVLSPNATYTSIVWSDASTNSTLAVNSAGIYWVELTGSNGCIARDSIVISVNPLPVANLGPDQQLCPGQQATVSPGAGFAGYLWSTGATTDSLTLTTSGTYWVEVTDGNGCTNRDTVTLSFFTITSTNILGNDTVICPFGSITLSPSSGFTSPVWNGTTPSPTLTVTAPGTYYVNALNSNGCDVVDTIHITLAPDQSANLAGPDGGICPFGSETLTVTGSYTNILWNGTTAGASFTTTTPGTFSVEARDPDGCIVRDTVVLTLLPDRHENLLGADGTICDLGTQTLSVSGSYTNILWNGTTATPTLTVNAPGIYGVEARDANGCVVTDSITLTLQGPQATNLLGNDRLICEEATITLDPGPGFTTVTWNDTLVAPTFDISISASVWVEAVDANGCLFRDTVSITEIALPPLSIQGPTEICPGDVVELVAQNTSLYDNISWSNGSVLTSITVQDTGVYTLVGVLTGCLDTATHIITTCPTEIFIPNVFTPNNDGINDVLNLKTQHLEEFTFVVMDRWGGKVFETRNLMDYWDGNMPSGKPAAEGVYYYVLSYKYRKWESTLIERVTGNVTLMR